MEAQAKARIAINGFGRVGPNLFRAITRGATERPAMERSCGADTVVTT